MLRVQRRNSTGTKGLNLSQTLWALVVGCLFSASASAANHLRGDCTGADYLKSTDHANPLNVDVVDLGDSLRDDESAASLDELSIDPDDSLAPLLYLGPRVATILENVFDDDTDAGLLDDEASNEFDEDESLSIERSPVAPIAERRVPTAIHSSDHPALTIEPAYLKIHRQMYRTDI